MPGGDRTGPLGMGPRTGWGAGFCAGYRAPGSSHPGYNAGGAFFGGRGGRGRRNRFFATGVPGWRSFAGNPIPDEMSFFAQPETLQSEMDVLKGQTRYLEGCLKDLQARMDVLAARNKAE